MKPTATGWIHGLSKDALLKELEGRGLSTEGNRDVLRARLVDDVRAKTEEQVTDEKLGSEEDRQTVREERRAETNKPWADTVTLLDTVRKWGIQFDGKDGITFLEQLEDLRDSYGLSREQLRRCLPLLFKDQALHWYRNNRDMWDSWKDFEDCIRQYYVPIKLKFELEEAIARRTQGPDEMARDYITVIQTVMRRHGQMSVEDKLKRAYHNLRPEYHLYIRRTDFRTLPNMLRLADDYEWARRYEKTYQAPSREGRPKEKTKTTAAALVTPGYKAQDCC